MKNLLILFFCISSMLSFSQTNQNADPTLLEISQVKYDPTTDGASYPLELMYTVGKEELAVLNVRIGNGGSDEIIANGAVVDVPEIL